MYPMPRRSMTMAPTLPVLRLQQDGFQSWIGVAPDAQLVVMQVFSNNGGAGWDTIMAALEDCVRLDVDSVNLSLVQLPALPPLPMA